MMNQTEQRVSRIVRLFFEGAYPQNITREVHRWLAGSAHQKEKEMALKEIWDEMIEPDNNPSKKSYRETYQSYEKIVARLGIANVEARPVVSLRRTAARIAAVLLPVIMVVGGALVMWNPLGTRDVQTDMAIETAAGQQRRVVLPDNSEVWLNSSSRISYPSDFAENRQVVLLGEARFAVRKSDGAPFTVQAGKLRVTVLGTEFNIKGYEGDATTEVSLLEGSVEAVSRKQKAILTPGQTLAMDNRTSRMSISQTAAGSIGWEPARLRFSDTPLEEAFRTIGVYYDMPVEFEGAVPSNRVTVNFLDNERIDNVLYILQNTTRAFEYDIADGKIKVRAK